MGVLRPVLATEGGGLRTARLLAANHDDSHRRCAWHRGFSLREETIWRDCGGVCVGALLPRADDAGARTHGAYGRCGVAELSRLFLPLASVQREAQFWAARVAGHCRRR